MRKILYLIVSVLLVFNCPVYGQEGVKAPILKNEISVSVPDVDLSNLSLKYAKNISDDWWFKIGFINLGGFTHENIPHQGSFVSTDTWINGGMQLGIEKHKLLTNRLELMLGLNAQMNYQYSNQSTQDPSVPVAERDHKVNTYIPGFGIGMGFFYKFNQNFLLGIEVNPSVIYRYEKSSAPNGVDREGFDFSLSNNGALLTLKYRF